MSYIRAIKNCIRWLTPYGLIMLHQQKVQQKVQQRVQKVQQDLAIEYSEKLIDIKNYFLNLNYNEQEYEIVEIIDYFKKYQFSAYPHGFIFPSEFTRNYHATNVEVFFDELNKTWYILHENKRLYFPINWKINEIQIYYNSLLVEQDIDSPHRYETKEFSVDYGDVIADVGAAEGIWALQNIEKASKVYLFECDPIWIDSLQKTFKPWQDKVVIVNKYASNTINENNVTMDGFFKNQEINFIKADIEGMELKLLEGCNKIIQRNKKIKLLLCTYHNENDAIELKNILEKSGLATEYSNGYMIFLYDMYLREPYIRRGLIRAKNR